MIELDIESLFSIDGPGVYDAEVLHCGVGRKVDAHVLDLLPRLRVVCSRTTGTEHIDYDACQQRGVDVLTLNDARCHEDLVERLNNVHATSEMTLALLMDSLRHTSLAMAATKWNYWHRAPFEGRGLRGLRVGILGNGRIGNQVKSTLNRLGCIVYTDPEPSKRQEMDVLTLHYNLEPANERIINNDWLSWIPPQRNIVFINTARGELIDEEAMVWALEEKRIGRYVADVMTDECSRRQYCSPLFRRMERNGDVAFTPHIGGFTVEAREQTESIMRELLGRWKAERTAAT